MEALLPLRFSSFLVSPSQPLFQAKYDIQIVNKASKYAKLKARIPKVILCETSLEELRPDT